MTSPSPTTVEQRLFDFLAPRGAHLPEDLIRIIANNLAFLVRCTGGAKVQPDQITITVIDVRGPNNNEIGHKATVCIHDGLGNFTVVIAKQVDWGQEVIYGLTEKADKAIKDILAKEGNAGYGDFKMG